MIRGGQNRLVVGVLPYCGSLSLFVEGVAELQVVLSKPKELLRFVPGTLYRHPESEEYYLAAYADAGYILVNVESGKLLSPPVKTMEQVDVYLASLRMVKVVAQVVVDG